MSFIIRQISRTADGREIVRPTTVQGIELTIGRATENEVHLPDLAVEPRQAVVREYAPGKIEVEALGTLGFGLNGRDVRRADIDAAQGAELRFGGHRIMVGMEGGIVTLSVERVEALSDASEAKDQQTVFTLRGLLPGKRLSAYGFIALILAAFLAWPVWTWASYKDVKTRPAGFHADKTWDAGPLSQAHHFLEGDCQACHKKPFVSVRDNACIECHRDVHDHAPSVRLALARGEPKGFRKVTAAFAHAFNKPDGRCVDCHTEHQGAGPMQPAAQRFCTDCHGDLRVRLPDTKLANVTDFGTGHPQFRPAVLVKPGPDPVYRRVSLDMNPTQDDGLKFPHALHLSKSNGVARMAQTLRGQYGFGDALACKDCHKADPSGVRFQPVQMEAACQMCHSLAFETIGGTVRTLRHGQPAQVVADLLAYYRSTPPSRPISLGSVARRPPGEAWMRETAADFAHAAAARPARGIDAVRAVFSKGGACYDCHTVIQPSPGSLDYRIAPVTQETRFLHKGWFDHNAHRQEPCETCHAARKSDSAHDLLLPGIQTCRQCHGGEASNAKVPSSCAMCHDYHAGDDAPWVLKRRDDREKGREVAMRTERKGP